MDARRFIGLLVGLTVSAGYAVACSTSATDGNGEGGAGGGGFLLDPGQCRSDSDCDAEQWQYCRAPDESVGCGACFGGDCFIDDDCVAMFGAGYICGPLEGPCVCGDGGECIPACAGPSDCQVTEDCDPGGLCLPRACTADDDCGDPAQRCASGGSCVVVECLDDSGCEVANQRCDTGNYRCVQLTCTGDADCGGFCVRGRCFSTPGVCQEPAA